MLDTRAARVATLAILTAALLWLCARFATLPPDTGAGNFPNAGNLLSDYDALVGREVLLTGTVVSTDPAVLEIARGGRVMRLVLRDLAASPAVGDRVQVHGTVRPGRVVEVIDAVVVPRSGLRYAWSVSFLAGLWVLGRLVRFWRIDPGRFAVVARSRPLAPASATLRNWLRRVIDRG